MNESDPLPIEPIAHELPFEEPGFNLMPEPSAEPAEIFAPTLHRVPHMGHALLFAVIVFILLMASQFGAMGLISLRHPGHFDMANMMLRLQDTKLQLATMTATYLAALLLSLAIFPRLWHRSFGAGIEWNADTARLLYARLIPAAMVLSWAVQLLQNYIPAPKSAPIDSFFTNATDIWLTAAFGTLLAPLTEEIFFRGFLLPAFAIAYDWVTLERTPESRLRWRTTDSLTLPALIVGGIVSSLFFAVLHAAQLGYSWSSVAVLLGVSFVLTFVRLRTQSVACSTLVHATYNFTIFLSLFIGSSGFRHLDKIK